MRSLVRAIICATMLAIIALPGAARPYTALAYSCGNPSSGHCYGVIDWYGPTPGLQFLVLVSSLHCYTCGSGNFVDNEGWLLQRTSGCSQVGPCWVEAGYWTIGASVGEQPEAYFWADARPGSRLYVHYGPSVSTVDLHAYARILIEQSSSNSYTIIVEGNNGTGTFWSDTSTSNGMSPNDINEGQELSGGGGASADSADFVENQWETNTGTFRYQNVNGSLTNYSTSPPPYINYVTYPSQSTTGGDIQTHCC